MLNIESKYYDLEFLSTLFHMFINLKLGLFYFDSLVGSMKLPRGPHAARGPQVGKPCPSVSGVCFNLIVCDDELVTGNL